LKIDKASDEANGVQMLKPIPGLDDLLERGGAWRHKDGLSFTRPTKRASIRCGTTIRAERTGDGPRINADSRARITITIADKVQGDVVRGNFAPPRRPCHAGEARYAEIVLPEHADQYSAIVVHPACLKVVALSGERIHECCRLSRNSVSSAAFSRALTRGCRPSNRCDARLRAFDAVRSLYCLIFVQYQSHSEDLRDQMCDSVLSGSQETAKHERDT
jgi:fructose-bisphosphate aldolase class I